MGLHMTSMRAATIWVAIATVLAVASAAQAQYYPPRPSEPVVRMGPPMAIEDADDPDIYAPPPPPTYLRRQLETPYPGQAQPGPYESRGQRQALPAPAPGTNFPAPADYPWVRERANQGAPIANEPATGPYGDRAPGQSGHMFNNGPGGPRPPGDINTGPNNAPAAINRGTAVASLPPEEQPEEGEPKELPPQFRRQVVAFQTREPAGTIIIDTPNTYLYLALGNGQAMRYGIGVGREGFTWTGAERISKMSEWPDWHPPKEMIERQPYLPRFMAGRARSISARRFIAFTAPTSPRRSAPSCRQAASGWSMTMWRIFTAGCRSAPAWWCCPVPPNLRPAPPAALPRPRCGSAANAALVDVRPPLRPPCCGA